MPPASDSHEQLAATLVATMQRLDALRLNSGRSGNASARLNGNTSIVTPSGVLPADLSAEQMCTIKLDPEQASPGASSEWRMHAAIYAQRPDVHGIVHVHSPYATALACAQREREGPHLRL